MKKFLLSSSATLLMVCAAIAAPDMKSTVARMPAYPATVQAAGAAFGGKKLETPTAPKAIADLERDLTNMNVQSTAASAPSASQAAANQATSQSIAQKMQGMTTEQRIAYAMQLQGQMAPARPAPMALDANGTRNAQAAGQIMQQTGKDQQALGVLQGKVGSFSNDWTIQDAKLSGKKEFLQQLCTEADRAANNAYLAPHLALASRSLPQGAALERDIRAIAVAAAGRSAQADAMVAQGAQGSVASAAASGSRTVAQSAILALTQLYDSAAIAAKWQHASDFNAHAPVMGPCKDNGGS
jgi:hypothetical protein